MLQGSRFLLTTLATMLAIAGCNGSSSTTAALAGNIGPSCDGYPQTGSNGVTVCDPRQFDNLPSTGVASISADNGDILSQGSSRGSIRVDAYVYATAPTEADAKNLASQVTIHTANNDFYATGPATGQSCTARVNGVCVNGSSSSSTNNQSWQVSFAAALPTQTSLKAGATNGVVEVDDLSGTEDISTTNGALYLAGLAGKVTASTTNGSIDMDLDGPTWNGQGVTVSATSGSIAFHAPSGYSAQFNLQSSNGSVHSDFSGQTQSSPNAQLTESTGHGGPTLQASTTNGDVDLLKKN